MRKKLIVVAGPTASGKTSLAVELAKHYKCPVLSADSRQFYKELSIGTAKPSPEEMDGVPHFFIDSHHLEDEVSAGRYEKEALEVLNHVYQTHDIAILVGGSGMFIKAITDGTDQLPHDPETRQKWNAIFDEKGILYLQAQIQEKDSELYKKIDLNNPVRLIRALELMELTNEKVSDLWGATTPNRSFETHFFVLDHPREVLYERINKRVDLMINEGLLEEVKSVSHLQHLQSLNTVGYKELFDYLAGKHGLNEAIEFIKQNTRRYAKRQLTWFRRVTNAHWIPYSDNPTILNFIHKKLK